MIDVNLMEVKELIKLVCCYLIVFVMMYKIYLDMFVLVIILVCYGIFFFYIFVGINMDFLGFG